MAVSAAVGCFHTPVARYSLARPRMKTLWCLCLFSKLLYVFLSVPSSVLLYDQYYILEVLVFSMFLSDLYNLRLCQIMVNIMLRTCSPGAMCFYNGCLGILNTH